MGRNAIKVKLAVNSGAAPDLALHHSFVAGAQGFAEPLDDLWEKWGAEDEFMESSLQDCTWNNVKYGVPFNITSVCLLYNEDMYKEAGITEAPTTLEEPVKCPKTYRFFKRSVWFYMLRKSIGDYSELLLQKATI